jgi:SAM-dependent methyltransferase
MAAPEETGLGVYAWDNGWEEARRRLDLLEQSWDPQTWVSLGEVGVEPGWCCLEVGGGGGSVVRWLCDAVGRDGRVVTVDIDTRFLETIDAPNLEVLQADVVTEGLPDGPFDLVHTRAVLMHIPARDRLLAELVARLRPGGTMVLEEFDFHSMGGSPSPAWGAFWLDAADILNRAVGLDGTWARHLPRRLHSLGLCDVRARMTTSLFRGGSAEAEFYRVTWWQARDWLLGGGMPKEVLDEGLALLDDDTQWLPGPANVTVSGRLPRLI